MIATSPDRRRLEEMVQFAAAYRGWSTRQLGEALQRDPGCLVPNSGTPKIDLIVRLANALDWPVADLLEHLSEPGPMNRSLHREQPIALPRAGTTIGPASHRSGRAANEGDAAFAVDRDAPTEPRLRSGDGDDDDSGDFCFASDAERLSETKLFLSRGDFDAAIELADDLGESDDPTTRVEAQILLAIALDRRGRPMRALAALQRAAQQPHPLPSMQLPLLARLADAYYRTGQSTEARAIATDALAMAADMRARDRTRKPVRFAMGLAHAVRAACSRDLALECNVHPALTRTAHDALDEAAEALREIETPEARGLGLTVDAGRAAISVVLGQQSITDAIRTAMNHLDDVVDPSVEGDRHRLIGLGWWCVITGAVAIRSMDDDDCLHRTLAILTNKADELASAVDCWALRERVLTLEHDRRCRLAEFAGHDDPWLLDHDDLRMIIGCMGASPRFRPLGLKILRRGVLIRSADRNSGPA